jgi:16S rRNA (guanine527-N7)-methyltransferase
VDVGSGGGAPGIPLAAALPEREPVLLEAERRKCAFLERWTPPNARVVWGRAEEQETDWAGAAAAKALAPPPVAAEWCLPLVRPGGLAVLWVGETADRDRVARVAAQLAAEPEDGRDGLLVLRKLGPTPSGFPRRTGVARKRPLA